MRFIKWLQKDFNRSTGTLSILLNRQIPKWLCVLYYMAWIPVVGWLVPFTYYFEEYYAPKKLAKILKDGSL